MDKKIKRFDLSNKRLNVKLIKDRGDNLKGRVYDKLKRSDRDKSFFPERGDTVRKLQNQPRQKINNSANFETLEKESVKRVMFDKPDKDIEKALQDLEERKRLKDKYVLKLKNSIAINNNSNKKDDKSVKVDGKTTTNKPPKKDSGDTSVKAKERPTDSSNESGKSEKGSWVQRRPIIKTVRNDATVYKAVTFVDQKKPTQLQITIPNETIKKVKPKFSDVVTDSLKPKVKVATSKSSVKEKPIVKKVLKKKPRSISPSHLITSPPTEVAKWVPSCVNQHTKPYYEAWVNTTLAAISKNTNDNKFYLEQKDMMEKFKRELERPFTPDLVYENCNDERYTGRIRVKQR